MRETGNFYDPSSVCMPKDENIVGHLYVKKNFESIRAVQDARSFH